MPGTGVQIFCTAEEGIFFRGAVLHGEVFKANCLHCDMDLNTIPKDVICCQQIQDSLIDSVFRFPFTDGLLENSAVQMRFVKHFAFLAFVKYFVLDSLFKCGVLEQGCHENKAGLPRQLVGNSRA